jgi:hypothetical protein
VKFALFVEGYTEQALPAFLKRWLDPRLSRRVGIVPVNFQGVGGFLSGFAQRATRDLASGQLIAVIGLIDLYGAGLPFPANLTIDAKYTWAKTELERQVRNERFSQHFAVHETEAWLLSDPSIFPARVRGGLQAFEDRPDEVNFREPPSKLLRGVYRANGWKYKKDANGSALFQKLDPERVRERCPHFRALLDDILALAKAAGL